MALLAACVISAPISRWLVLAMLLYFVMGSARGVGGVAITTSLMEMVPQHLMGRVQNAFYFGGTLMQLVLAVTVGAMAHKVSLVAAFSLLGCVYGLSFVAASWPVRTPAAVADVSMIEVDSEKPEDTLIPEERTSADPCESR